MSSKESKTVEELEKSLDSWKQKFKELKASVGSGDDEEVNVWKKKFHELEAKVKSSASASKKKANPLLKGIERIVNKKIDYIKHLVKTGQIQPHDVNPVGQTLLITAAWYGALDITNFCLNAGFDVHQKDDEGKDALDRAVEAGHYHVEQILLFATMNLNVGSDIRKSAALLNRQIGANNNVMNELRSIGQTSKQLFEKTLMEIMINIFNKRLCFADSLLNLCWNITCRDHSNPLNSELWKVIKSACCYVIAGKSKRDWYWLKECVLQSTLWFQEVKKSKTDAKPCYLYFELLEWVNAESRRQVEGLERDLNTLAGQNKADYNTLTKWCINPTAAADADAATDATKTVRQDLIPNGIVSRYTYTQLVATSGVQFNSPGFYDYNEYLSKLILVAQIVDDEFQQSVQEIFEVDLVTNIGNVHVSDVDEKENAASNGKVHYSRGPVKLMERARAKAQNDYGNEQYPTIACVLDINRCSLVFNDVTTLLKALRLFVNRVKYFQSGNIIGIARDKNGFFEYVKETQYADIKLNVIIKGKESNIIGEVQFLLDRMKRFKDRAHSLYAIQRQKEVFEESAERIMPLLLNDEKQIRVAGSLGDVKHMCRLLVIKNKTFKDLMATDEASIHILHGICMFGHNKAFDFLSQLCSKEQFIAYLTSLNHYNMVAIDYAVELGQAYILQRVLEYDEIREYYKSGEHLFRLLYWLFAYNREPPVTTYVLATLNITKQQLIEILQYNPPRVTVKVHRWGHFNDQMLLLNQTLKKGHITGVKQLVGVIGEDAVIQNILNVDGWNTNGFEAAIRNNNLTSVQFILKDKSQLLQYIKETYSKNDALLFRLIYVLFLCNQNMIDLVLFETLGVSQQQIVDLMTTYKYEYAQDVVALGSYPPHECAAPTIDFSIGSIVNELIKTKSMKQVKRVVSVIGEKAFVMCVFNANDTNGVRTAIECRKLNTLQYMMAIDGIKSKCNEVKQELWSIVSALNDCHDIAILKYSVRGLQLNDTKLEQLKSYKSLNLTNKKLLEFI